MYALVEVTTAGEDESKRIGKIVVSERLAACANIIPACASFYWWKGKLVEDSESVLLLKTTEDNVEKLISRVHELHSYENPAIISLPFEKGSRSYLNWVFNEVKG